MAHKRTGLENVQSVNFGFWNGKGWVLTGVTPSRPAATLPAQAVEGSGEGTVFSLDTLTSVRIHLKFLSRGAGEEFRGRD